MSYHVREINRGEFGEISKIQEELEELEDAEYQEARIMILNELADIVGAVEGYLEKHFDGITLDDIITMSNLTKQAFKTGRRK